MSSGGEAITINDIGSEFRAMDREQNFNAVVNRLQFLDVTHSEVLSNLSPNAIKRVLVLMQIQAQYDDFEEKYFEERAALDAKYQLLYRPLYSKRSEILTGEVDVVDAEEWEGKGVPGFWRTAMKNNSVLADEIFERDEDALRYLKDIKWSRIGNNAKGFKLEFFFDANPYFKNRVLTKTYYLADEYEPVLDRAIGTEIEWYPGRILSHRIMRKKKGKGKAGKPERRKSFFNFFDPPQLPEEDDEISAEVAEEHQNLMELDYDIGSTIRDKIVPHAVSWFTGKAQGRP